MSVEGAIPMLAPIPCYRFPESAVVALAHAVDYGNWRQKAAGIVPDFSRETARARELLAPAFARAEGWLTPREAHDVLDALGIGVLRTVAAANEDDIVTAAAALGYPVALKGIGPDILHKSDAGAVALGLADADQLRAAYRDFQARLSDRLTAAQVQPMAPDGVEMFIGGIQDPTFGPVVFCGSGGVLVELFRDAVCRLCPVSDRDVEEMLAACTGARRLRGYRGKDAVDDAALGAAVLRVSALLEACPEIREMDINPITVIRHGAVAVDVRIRVGALPAPAPTRRVQY
jgi:acyl-CoA synthetase (NDP forming)